MDTNTAKNTSYHGVQVAVALTLTASLGDVIEYPYIYCITCFNESADLNSEYFVIMERDLLLFSFLVRYSDFWPILQKNL